MSNTKFFLLAATLIGATYSVPAAAGPCPTTLQMKYCWFTFGEVVLPNTRSVPYVYGNIYTYPDPTGGYTTQGEAVQLATQLMAEHQGPGDVTLYLGYFNTRDEFSAAVHAQVTCNPFTDNNCPKGRYYTGTTYMPHT